MGVALKKKNKKLIYRAVEWPLLSWPPHYPPHHYPLCPSTVWSCKRVGISQGTQAAVGQPTAANRPMGFGGFQPFYARCFSHPEDLSK